MSSSKFLSDAGWRAAAAKNKIRDNGLQVRMVISDSLRRLGKSIRLSPARSLET